jgi:hypothetical protein
MRLHTVDTPFVDSEPAHKPAVSAAASVATVGRPGDVPRD